MTDPRPVSDPAAMADILASIRRIVAEEDRKFEHAPLRGGAPDGVLVLTQEMRIDAPAVATPQAASVSAATVVAPPAPAAAQPEALDASPGLSPGLDDVELSADEAVMVDIARAVFAEEVERLGAEALAPGLREIVREEVARALAARG
ncbi:MAG: hypothetical protein ACFCUS_05090 [Rubrimonas sp.]